MKSSLGQYEFRHFGEHNWQRVSEKTVMEKLADTFERVTPVLSKMLSGEEIITSRGIYRKIYN
jgi:hypothetical protein